MKKTTLFKIINWALSIVFGVPFAMYVTHEYSNLNIGFGVLIGIGVSIVLYLLSVYRYRCSKCGKLLNPFVAIWQDELSFSARIRAESHINTIRIFKCLKCKRYMCEKCILDNKMRCSNCGALNMNTGYYLEDGQELPEFLKSAQKQRSAYTISKLYRSRKLIQRA